MRLALALVACGVLAACGPQAKNAAVMTTGEPRHAVAAVVVHPVGPPIPAALPVGFANLPPGMYRVHLHSICSGLQNYHLAYLPDLVVDSAHTGKISVATEDFGRGWCVIVYKDAAHNIVLVTQPI